MAVPLGVLGSVLTAVGSAIAEGSSAARAGEVAAREVMKWTLEQKGFGADAVRDVNELRKNFPGIDLATRENPVQVKVLDLAGNQSKLTVGRAIAHEKLKLAGAKPWIKLQDKAAAAILDAYAELKPALPPGLTADAPLQLFKDYVRDTVMAVPSEDVVPARAALAQMLFEDPKLRELFPETRLGNLLDARALTGTEQTSLASKIQGYVFKYVVGIGVSKPQLRAMVAAGQAFATGP
jgi:hypothetical protein